MIIFKKTSGLYCDYFSIFCYYNARMDKKFSKYVSLDFIPYNANLQSWTDIKNFLRL